VHAVKPYGMEVQLHAFLTSRLEDEWSASRPDRPAALPPEDELFFPVPIEYESGWARQSV